MKWGKILRRFETAVSSSVRNNAVKQCRAKCKDTNLNLHQEYLDLHTLHSFYVIFCFIRVKVHGVTLDAILRALAS